MVAILLMRPLYALTDQNASTVVPAGFTRKIFWLKKEFQKIFMLMTRGKKHLRQAGDVHPPVTFRQTSWRARRRMRVRQRIGVCHRERVT
jgi:hypothetical protein